MYTDFKEIGRRIAARRKELGLRQGYVNEDAGLSDKYLSNIENARLLSRRRGRRRGQRGLHEADGEQDAVP